MIAVAATVVYLVLRWVVAPLLVRALSSGMSTRADTGCGAAIYLRVWALDLMLALSPLPGAQRLTADSRLSCASSARGVGRDVHVGTAIVSIPP